MHDDTQGFHTTLNRGFQMDFANGWTFSCQWGPGNYCEAAHRDKRARLDEALKHDTWDSTTAEVAAWHTYGTHGVGRGEWFLFDDGAEVLGHQRPDAVLRWMNHIAAMSEVRNAR